MHPPRSKKRDLWPLNIENDGRTIRQRSHDSMARTLPGFQKGEAMKMMTTVLAFAALTSAALAAEIKYPLTGSNTKVEWTGTKSDGKHNGGFKKLKGSAIVDDDDGLSFDVEIDCGSLYSDNEKLTGHLKSPDFFSVKEHPTAKFKSTKVEKGEKGSTVTGDLTLLGKTKEISFPAEIDNKGKLSLKADFKIDRTDFGMTYGKGKVDEQVSLRIRVDAKNAKK
jgi:polyisoprenoid-binding protein YceI